MDGKLLALVRREDGQDFIDTLAGEGRFALEYVDEDRWRLQLGPIELAITNLPPEEINTMEPLASALARAAGLTGDGDG